MNKETSGNTDLTLANLTEGESQRRCLACGGVSERNRGLCVHCKRIFGASDSLFGVDDEGMSKKAKRAYNDMIKREEIKKDERMRLACQSPSREYFEPLMHIKHSKELKERLQELEDVSLESLCRVLDLVRPIDPSYCECDAQKGRMVYYNENRTDWVRIYFSWCLPPDLEGLSRLVEFIAGGRVLEICAGTGLCAKILELTGISVVATDVKSFQKKGDYQRDDGNFQYARVETLSDSEAVTRYGAEVELLMVIWPRTPLNREDLRQFKGNKMIIIGEDDGGATANMVTQYSPFEYQESDHYPPDYQPYEDREEDWEMVDIIDIPDWKYANSVIMCYERK